MIHNREGFLDSVASALGRSRRSENVPVPNWTHRPQEHLYNDFTFEELLDLFRKSSRAVKANLVETERLCLQEIIEEVVEEHGGGPIVVPDDPDFQQFGLNPLLERADVYTWGTHGGKTSIEKAEQANIGLTISETAFAESGTVVSSHTKGYGRVVGMLPTTHIAIVPVSTIVPRMTAYVEKLRDELSEGKRLASCVNLASGPSNSADIELKSVVGVHGPIKVTYILVTDQ